MLKLFYTNSRSPAGYYYKYQVILLFFCGNRIKLYATEVTGQYGYDHKCET